MSQFCPHCGSKYTVDKGIGTNTKELCHKYYCESCRKYFEVATGAKGAKGTWLMTVRRGSLSAVGANGWLSTPDNYIAIYRTPEGKIQINQRFTGDDKKTSYISGEVTPCFYVFKGSSHSLHISTEQSAFDSNGVDFYIDKIEMNSEIAAKARADFAMRGRMSGNTFDHLACENFELAEDRRAFLQSIIGAPTNPNAKTSTGGGCYVATAVYGSYDCPEVWTLRRFRDNTLASTWYGRAFIHTYYAISPTLVKWFGHTTWFKNLWRGKLDKMVDALQKQGVESTPYQDKNW